MNGSETDRQINFVKETVCLQTVDVFDRLLGNYTVGEALIVPHQ